MTYELRLKLKELAQVGLITTDEHYAMQQVLSNARLGGVCSANVEHAESLLLKLLDLSQLVHLYGPAAVVPPEPRPLGKQVYIVGPPDTAGTLALHMMALQRRIGGDHYFTPLTESHFSEPRPGSDPHNQAHVHIEQQFIDRHHGRMAEMARAIIGSEPLLFGQREHMMGEPSLFKPEVYCSGRKVELGLTARPFAPEPVKDFPKPKFNGYMSARKRKPR